VSSLFFNNLINSCFNSFESIKQNTDLLDNYLSTINVITDWKFSKDGYCFYPIPHRNQLMGFSSKTESKANIKDPADAKTRDLYSFGFIDDKLSVCIDPTKLDDHLIASVFLYPDNSEIDIFNITKSESKNRAFTRLDSLGKVIWLEPATTRIEVTVGIEGQYSISLLNYIDNKLCTETRYSKDWATEQFYKFYYNKDGDLESVVTIDTNTQVEFPIWKSR
jgi:hypothetical protein